MRRFEGRLDRLEKLIKEGNGDQGEKEARAREAVQTVIRRLLGNWNNFPRGAGEDEDHERKN